MHFFNNQICDDDMFGFGGGCKYTFLFKFSPWKKAHLMSIYFNYYSFEGVVDNNS